MRERERERSFLTDVRYSRGGFNVPGRRTGRERVFQHPASLEPLFVFAERLFRREQE